MKIRVTCTACGNHLSAPQSYAGKLARCPTCKTILRVPYAFLVPNDRFPDASLLDDLSAGATGEAAPPG